MYLNSAYHRTVKPAQLMEIVDATAAAIKTWNAARETPITHIVCTGSSGQAVAWPVSYKLGIPICVVRKPDEKSHAGLISGDGTLRDYIIVDDLIDSGATIDRVLAAIATASGEQDDRADNAPKCAAIFLYQPHWGGGRPPHGGIPVIQCGKDQSL